MKYIRCLEGPVLGYLYSVDNIPQNYEKLHNHAKVAEAYKKIYTEVSTS